jgi:hypothetical protein
MKHFYLTVLTILITLSVFAQSEDPYFFRPEIMLGKTMEANTDFPETKLQTTFFLNYGTYHNSNKETWAEMLGHPKTGLSIGYTNFGNSEFIGNAFSLMPFMEFGLFQKKTKKLNLLVGIGMSYIDKQYHITKNPFNKGISTKLNWAFKSFLYYKVMEKEQMNLRLGLGYLHHSNGHIKLPNQGLNSFLLSVSSQFDFNKEETAPVQNKVETTRTSENYYSIRTGIGQNVLSQAFNDKKEVYSAAISYGKIINKTFKFGGGVYYRFYEKYYDHIKNKGDQVEEQVPEYINNPYKYATNYGVFGTAELLINHIGIEFDLGYNIYKPFYKIDWQLSQGYTYTVMEDGEPQTAYVLEELSDYYKLKKAVSSRLGLKYYIMNTNNSPNHNVFLGAHINANLGQADFSEFSIGYVYRFNKK